MTTRIHYCRRLSVKAVKCTIYRALVNIANMNQERKLLSEVIRLVVLVGEDLLAALAAGHAVLLLLEGC
jgi:hypothetical protein